MFRYNSVVQDERSFACTKSNQAKRTTYQPAADESYTELSSPRKIFVQVLRGRLCFRGVSWLLLCTSKEVTRWPKDSGSSALVSKEVTRSACGRAEALALTAIRAPIGRRQCQRQRLRLQFHRAQQETLQGHLPEPGQDPRTLRTPRRQQRAVGLHRGGRARVRGRCEIGRA